MPVKFRFKFLTFAAIAASSNQETRTKKKLATVSEFLNFALFHQLLLLLLLRFLLYWQRKHFKYGELFFFVFFSCSGFEMGL